MSTSAKWTELAYSSPINFDCISPSPTQSMIESGDNKIILFPNPSSGEFKLSNLPNNWYIAVYSVSGSKIMEQSGSDDTLNLKLNLPEGMYFIKVISKINGEETQFKFLVK